MVIHYDPSVCSLLGVYPSDQARCVAVVWLDLQTPPQSMTRDEDPYETGYVSDELEWIARDERCELVVPGQPLCSSLTAAAVFDESPGCFALRARFLGCPSAAWTAARVQQRETDEGLCSINVMGDPSNLMDDM